MKSKKFSELMNRKNIKIRLDIGVIIVSILALAAIFYNLFLVLKIGRFNNGLIGFCELQNLLKSHLSIFVISNILIAIAFIVGISFICAVSCYMVNEDENNIKND